MLGLYPAKIIYIVDSKTFDAVCELGFKLTILVRFQLKGMPKIPHEQYKQVKRCLSDALHKEQVFIKVADFTNTKFYDVWEADVYKKVSNEMVSLNTSILESVNKILGELK